MLYHMVHGGVMMTSLFYTMWGQIEVLSVLTPIFPGPTEGLFEEKSEIENPHANAPNNNLTACPSNSKSPPPQFIHIVLDVLYFVVLDVVLQYSFCFCFNLSTLDHPISQQRILPQNSINLLNINITTKY